jgi:hypothetical protein
VIKRDSEAAILRAADAFVINIEIKGKRL